jgi:phage antirepressor YoqD-like protein
MNKLPLQRGVTMNSLDLREIINAERLAAGETEVRNNTFVMRVEDELAGELPTTQFMQSQKGGEPAKFYALTIEQCMLIGMRESKAVRRSVLVELKKHDQPAKQEFVLPATMAEALRLAADQSEQLEIAAPKVAFVDRYVAAEGDKGFRETAKLLGVNEAEFREYLLDHKIVYRLGKSLTGYAQHIDAGRLTTKAVIDAAGKARNQALFTPKGVEWIAGMLAKSRARELL